MVTLGTGVGGGMFVGGQPYRGSRGMGGEIGHVVVDLAASVGVMGKGTELWGAPRVVFPRRRAPPV